MLNWRYGQCVFIRFYHSWWCVCMCKYIYFYSCRLRKQDKRRRKKRFCSKHDSNTHKHTRTQLISISIPIWIEDKNNNSNSSSTKNNEKLNILIESTTTNCCWWVGPPVCVHSLYNAKRKKKQKKNETHRYKLATTNFSQSEFITYVISHRDFLPCATALVWFQKRKMRQFNNALRAGSLFRYIFRFHHNFLCCIFHHTFNVSK